MARHRVYVLIKHLPPLKGVMISGHTKLRVPYQDNCSIENLVKLVTFQKRTVKWTILFASFGSQPQ